MTISRAQMRRQLYMGGGIASLEPRQQYGLGSIVKSVSKAVKGVTKGVKNIISSDVGKLALLAAGGYYLGGGTFGGFAKPFSQTALGKTAFGQAVATPFQYAGTKIGGMFSKVPSSVLGMEQVIPGASIPGMSFGTKAALGIGGASLLGGIFGSRQEALDLYESDRSEFNAKVQQYVKNLNPSKQKEVLEQIQTDISKLGDVSQAEELFRRNVAAEGGIMNIPMGEPRLNQQGVKELDYRQEGGFVPIGIKEKADDVPAMLSKNEFVMTADAVRGAGNGDVEKGAQIMYDNMKRLESRIA